MILSTEMYDNGPYTQKWKVQSHSNPDKIYTVAKRREGGWECSCPHWIFRRALCKHIEEVQSEDVSIKEPIVVETPTAPASREELDRARIEALLKKL